MRPLDGDRPAPRRPPAPRRRRAAATAAALAQARQEAAAAARRYQALDREARRATNDADRARAASAALAARIEAAEADLTAAERRIALIGELQAAQRARLAERQGPIVRLTAALQMMTRRPAALALVQPGSVRDAVHVRSLLAAALPEIRRRTAALRLEVQRSAALRRQSEMARQGLIDSREALRQRRVALAGWEAAQRNRSQQLTGLALTQSDRALVYGEEAQVLQRDIGTRDYRGRARRRAWRGCRARCRARGPPRRRTRKRAPCPIRCRWKAAS